MEGGAALRSQASPPTSGLPMLSQRAAAGPRTPVCSGGTTVHGDVAAHRPPGQPLSTVELLPGPRTRVLKHHLLSRTPRLPLSLKPERTAWCPEGFVEQGIPPARVLSVLCAFFTAPCWSTGPEKPMPPAHLSAEWGRGCLGPMLRAALEGTVPSPPAARPCPGHSRSPGVCAQAAPRRSVEPFKVWALP